MGSIHRFLAGSQCKLALIIGVSAIEYQRYGFQIECYYCCSRFGKERISTRSCRFILDIRWTTSLGPHLFRSQRDHLNKTPFDLKGKAVDSVGKLVARLDDVRVGRQNQAYRNAAGEKPGDASDSSGWRITPKRSHSDRTETVLSLIILPDYSADYSADYSGVYKIHLGKSPRASCLKCRYASITNGGF